MDYTIRCSCGRELDAKMQVINETALVTCKKCKRNYKAGIEEIFINGYEYAYPLNVEPLTQDEADTIIKENEGLFPRYRVVVV